MQRLLLRFFISGFNVLNRIHKSYILGYLNTFTAEEMLNWILFMCLESFVLSFTSTVIFLCNTSVYILYFPRL